MFRRQVRKQRTKFERELRQRRTRVERTVKQNRRRLEREGDGLAVARDEDVALRVEAQVRGEHAGDLLASREGTGALPAFVEERASAYGIDPGEELEDFYRKRSMLKLSVFPEDIAEAIYLFATDASAKSTANILNVDAGNAQSFPR